jgi:hypothetical protein
MPRAICLITIHKSMMKNIMSFSSINSPNLMLRIVYMIYNVTFSILKHGSLILNKIREFVLRGINLDVALAPLLETNVILNARASLIIKHASSKFKIFIF